MASVQLNIIRNAAEGLQKFSLHIKLKMQLKGPAHSQNENFYFLAPAQSKRMQPILVSSETPFSSNFLKTTGPVGVMTLTGAVFFLDCS